MSKDDVLWTVWLTGLTLYVLVVAYSNRNVLK